MPTKIKGTDGKTYTIDDKGNILSTEDATPIKKEKKALPSGISLGISPEIFGVDVENPEIGPLATSVGGLLGEALASRIPGGNIVLRALMRSAGGFSGGIAGSALGSTIDKSDKSAIGESAANQLLSEGFRGASIVGPPLLKFAGSPIQRTKEFAIKKFLQPHTTPQLETALTATPEIANAITPAQLAGKGRLDIAHAIVPREAEEIVRGQQTAVDKAINRILTDLRGGPPVQTPTRSRLGTLAEKSQATAHAQQSKERMAVSEAFDDIIKVEAPKNKLIIKEQDPDLSKAKKIALPDGTYKVVPNVIEKEIQGPIDITGMRNAFKDKFDELNAMFGEIETGANPLVQNAVKGLRSELGALFQGQPFRQYKDIKALRTKIQTMLADIPPGYKDRVQGLFASLRSHLRDDIETSMAGDLWKNSSGVVQKLDRANTLAQSMKEAFNDEIQGALYGDATEFFRNLMKSPEKVRQYNRILTGFENKKDPKVGSWFILDNIDNFMERGAEIPFLKAKEALAAWKTDKHQALVREALPANIRNQYENLLLAATRVDPRLSQAGVVALGIREAGLAITAASSTAKSILGGTIQSGLLSAAAGISFVIGAKDFAREVMLNPKMLSTVRTLMTAPPSSTHAQQLTRNLFLMMKGAQVVMQTANGPVNGRINKEGKFEPIQ